MVWISMREDEERRLSKFLSHSRNGSVCSAAHMSQDLGVCSSFTGSPFPLSTHCSLLIFTVAPKNGPKNGITRPFPLQRFISVRIYRHGGRAKFYLPAGSLLFILRR